MMMNKIKESIKEKYKAKIHEKLDELNAAKEEAERIIKVEHAGRSKAGILTDAKDPEINYL